MKYVLVCLLLSGCAFTDCRPWFPPQPIAIVPTQSSGVTIEDDFPDLGIGTKCRY